MPVWHLQLLGGLRATHGSRVLAQFPSRPVAMLLARLALQPQRRHSREELIELLWPGVAPDVGRNRLRQVLSTLRRLLEPPGVPPDSVLRADRQTVGLNDDAVHCDASEFEQLLRRGAVAQALDCYRGDLLPGFVDEWVEDERMRLTALYERTVAQDGGVLRARNVDGLRTAQRAAVAMDLREGAHRLPAYVSVFFGRERDRRQVLEALAQHRLVTLTGMGGFGKTRLAVECARATAGFESVAFVALGECSDARLIANCIRDALHMEVAQEDALAQLRAFLPDQDVLLVLDNFEQLVEDGTRVVVDLLERLPRLRLLVTSRCTLNVPGEHVHAVDPLPVPQSAMDAAEAAANPSLALFIDRARGARPDFGLTEDNRAPLIELCRALEGLPLAIEIAASRIRAYSPPEMCAALAERFDLLTRQGQRGGRYGRHASLQTAIDWSWNLLSPALQRFFAALSVFRGSWTAEAAESVCRTADARGHLEALVGDSLLRAEVDGRGATRFSMLETLREFAQERLDADARDLRARHRAYFLGLARRAAAADAAIDGNDFANLKQALASALEDGEAAYALDLGVALRQHWEARGTLPDELRLLEQAVASCHGDEPSLHAGLDLLAQLMLTAGDTEAARGYATRALAAAADDAACRAIALITLARIDWERDQHEAAVNATLDEALALAANAGASSAEADAWRVKATVALMHGSVHADYGAADALFARAETLYRRAGQPRWAHRVMLSRGGCMTGLERYVEARELVAICERYFGELDSIADLIAVTNMTGYLESSQEHRREAVAAGRRCVRLARDRHAHLWLATALWNLPQPLAMLGEVEVAVTLMSFAARFWEEGIGPLSPHDLTTVEEVRRQGTERLDEPRSAALWARGAGLTLAQAVELALNG